MAVIYAKQALLDEGWATNVRLDLRDGRIVSINPGTGPEANDTRVDTLLPALGNLHSHAFQRAMAGMTEFRQAGRDSFWTWRELMYRFMERLTPEQIEAIAAQVYVEMLEAGYASVGEFHYIHHQPGGAPYDNIAELSERIFAAASRTGIGLTHLPVLYSYGGAGQAELSAGQQRFGNNVDDFEHLFDAASAALRHLPGMRGSASHPIPCAPPRPGSCRGWWRGTGRGRSTSTSPSNPAKCARSKTGWAHARSNGCSTISRWTTAGA